MEHSDSDNNEHSSSSDSQEDIYSPPRANNLRPYDFEPAAVVSGDNVALRENEGALSHESRIGNINWCVCGNCQRMETEEESRCCREADEVPEEFFSGHPCVTCNEDFRTVCLSLNKDVLKTALSALNNMRGDRINITNRSLRYAGYRQYKYRINIE